MGRKYFHVGELDKIQRRKVVSLLFLQREFLPPSLALVSLFRIGHRQPPLLTGFRRTALLRGCFPSLYHHSGLTSPVLHRASSGRLKTSRGWNHRGLALASGQPLLSAFRLAQGALCPLSVGPVPSVPSGSLPSLRLSLSADDLSSRDAKTWRLHGSAQRLGSSVLPPTLCASLTSCSSTPSTCSLALFTGFSSAYKRDHDFPGPKEQPSAVPSPSAACISPSLPVFLREHPGLTVFFSLQPGFRSCRVSPPL